MSERELPEASTPSASSAALTIVQEEANTQGTSSQASPSLRLTLKKPKSDKKVQWNEGTVDNENMNKKKSKCCCIYKKPKSAFDESSSDTDDECENCFGHVEVRKENSTQGEGGGATATPPPSPEVEMVPMPTGSSTTSAVRIPLSVIEQADIGSESIAEPGFGLPEAANVRAV